MQRPRGWASWRRGRSRLPRCARSIRRRARRRIEESAAAPGFSLRDSPRRYKHLFVYSGDQAAT